MCNDADRWQEIEALYQSVRERGTDILEGADPELRREVETLLAQCGFPVDRPAWDLDLKPGTKLGPYEILSKLGEGGMAKVYRARDTRLKRSVAIKVISERFSDRFEREARAVAALNHSNICQLYDIGPNYLVMEFIDGPTLADRLQSGPLPLTDAMDIGRQMADALEAAHDRGIIHRDLKPENVKLAQGKVKVLDFGLAKFFEARAADTSATHNTVQTEPGIVLGTVPYMAPEQAQGLDVDKRADIWAFGCVLFEILTGRKAFSGKTKADIVASLFAAEPEYGLVPPKVVPLLRRCLDKSPRTRLRDIGEARVAIETGFPDAETSQPRGRARFRFDRIMAAAFAISAFGLAFLYLSNRTPDHPQRFRFEVKPPLPGVLVDFQLSPNGQSLALGTGESSSSGKIWVRSLDSPEMRLMTTIQGMRHLAMFWSWKGDQLAFQSANALYKIPLDGGPAVRIADVPDSILRGVWLDTDDILYATSGGLFRVSSTGGTPVKIDDQSTNSPACVSDGTFLYERDGGIYVTSLSGRHPARIISGAKQPFYVPPSKFGSRIGYVLFMRGDALLAQVVKSGTFERIGDEIPVESSTLSGFSASRNGILVLNRVNAQSVSLTWLDRRGKRLQDIGQSFTPGPNAAIRLSPDNSKAIVPILGQDGRPDLWIAELKRGLRLRFTFAGSFSGIWSPDGQRVLWAAYNGRRYIKRADGSGSDELVFTNPSCETCFLDHWSADGRFVATTVAGEKVAFSTWLVPMDGNRKPYPYLQYPSNYWVQISPDSRWMAYTADQIPQPQEVFVESIPRGKGKWQISNGGGDWPMWREDGKELFYRRGATIVAVPIRLTDATVEVGTPQALFDLPAVTRFQVSRDGERFLIAVPQEGVSTSAGLLLDTNWLARLGK